MQYNIGRYRLNPRGEFNNTIHYDFLDVVYYNGSSYVCINQEGCRAIIPSLTDNSFIYWQCIASMGNPGYNTITNFPVEVVNESLNFLEPTITNIDND